MGEDIAGGAGAPGEEDAWGGVLGVTKGLYGKFPGRVLDTPISESAFIGAAVGAGDRRAAPVVELMFVDFMGVCFDQIFNQAAKFRYMFGGKAVTPGRRSARCGAPGSARPRSTRSACYPVFTHIPGLKVGGAVEPVRRQGPADPGDPRRRPGDLLRAQDALRHRGRGARGELRDPVRRGEHRPRGRRRHDRRDRPHGEHRAGGGGRAGRRRASRCEIIDPRTTSPARHRHDPRERWRTPGGWSWSTRRTRAARSPPTSPASSRRRPSGRCGRRSSRSPGPHTPVPFADSLEDLFIPDATRIAAAVKTVVDYGR